MKKTNSKTTKSSTKTKEPVLSTGKKIGLTVYFTFIFTLMGIMGLQIWMNSMGDDINNSPLTTQQTEQQQPETTPTQNSQTQNYNYNEQSSPSPSTVQTPDIQSNTQNQQTFDDGVLGQTINQQSLDLANER